ncbi:MAG: signal peptidase II [Tyzzerella sp.]|nr:signal peptidase II [Tyzzerella sp.]
MIYILGLIGVMIGVALDQFTKYLAVAHIKEEPIILIDGVLELRYLENRGAAFGMLQNRQWFFLIITVITLFIIVYTYIKLPRERHYTPLRICMIALTAGAIGNMINRINLQYVVDFIYVKLIDFPIFNVADIFATCSTIALIVLFLFFYSEEDFDLIFSLIIPKRKNKEEL